MWPKVSIIWLNYNSSKFMPIALRSLESVAELDYPPDKYELIVVDNCSTDGSYERIRDFLEKKSGLRKKLIRLNRNLGFTGGNNVGFAARDKESKYVLLLNNDAVLFQQGLKTLVEYGENDTNIAGLQGIVLKYGAKSVDTAGGYLNELLEPYTLGLHCEYPWALRKPMYVTYIDGCCAFYRVEGVLRSSGDKLFIDELFGYYDDTALGLMLWNRKYKLIVIPDVVAAHARNLSFGKGKSSLSVYLSERNRVALSLVTNTRYKHVVLLRMLRRALASAPRTELGGFARVEIRALFDGMELGMRLRSKGLFMDLYKAPLVKIPLQDVWKFLVLGRLVTKYFAEWLGKNLRFLVVE